MPFPNPMETDVNTSERFGNWQARAAATQNVQAWGQMLVTSVKGVNDTSCVSEDSLMGTQWCP